MINKPTMRPLLLTVLLILVMTRVKSQTADGIIGELKSINKEVASKPCGTGTAQAISNRAMNVFLADKTGYLSESGDLSFYTNYVTLNTAEGKLTLNHNLQKAKGIDEPIKSLFNFGVNANIANRFSSTFLDKQFENELGVTLNYKWISKPKTHFSYCNKESSNGNQKQAMDALRAAILHSLEIEIIKIESDFKAAINAIDSADIPGQDLTIAKTLAQKNFYEDLKEEYAEKFARLQAETLTKTNNFKLITTGWTSFTIYIPLAYPKYHVAQSITTAFREKHPYPLQVILSHTRLWESSKAGRFFLTLGSQVSFSNSKLSHALDQTNIAGYKNLGGTDTLRLVELKSDKVYIGLFETFVTSLFRGRLVYFPPASHVGVSFSLEQNIGRYSILNSRIGIPIVLINSKKLPAVNFEFYVARFDMINKIQPASKSTNKTSIGLGVGIPFSRLMY